MMPSHGIRVYKQPGSGPYDKLLAARSLSSTACALVTHIQWWRESWSLMLLLIFCLSPFWNRSLTVTCARVKDQLASSIYGFLNFWQIHLKSALVWKNIFLSYFSQFSKIVRQVTDFGCQYIRLHTIYQRETFYYFNISINHFAFLSEKIPQLSGLPESLRIYYSWCDLQMYFKMVLE